MRTRLEAEPSVLNEAAAVRAVRTAPRNRRLGQQRRGDRDQGRTDPRRVQGQSTWMALGATAPFLRCSCGYVGVNDGWTDLHDNRKLDWEYQAALRRQHRPDRPDRSVARDRSSRVGLGLRRHATSCDHDAVPIAGHAVRREPAAISRGMEPDVARFCAGGRRSGPARGAALRAQRQPAARARGQELSRRDDRRAEHSLGQQQRRRRAGRLPPGVDARPGAGRAGAARRRRRRDAAAGADLSRRLAARGRRLLPELLDRRATRTGTASSSTKCRFRSCWRGGCSQAHALGAFDPVRDGGRGVRVPDAGRAGDAAGALGRSGRLFAVDAGDQHRRADLRRRAARGRRRSARRPTSSASTPTSSRRTSRRGR